jgi:hypothetical protein
VVFVISILLIALIMVLYIRLVLEDEIKKRGDYIDKLIFFILIFVTISIITACLNMYCVDDMNTFLCSGL